MYKIVLKQLGCGLVYGVLFLVLFHLLQHETFYSKTLGRISENYEYRGDFFKHEIVKVNTPFVRINPDELRHWDAAIYYNLKTMLYDTARGRDNEVRPAFFPLFPLAWKALHTYTRGICVANFLFFLIALIILVNVLVEDEKERSFIFLSCLPLPSLIFYIVPYSEAVYLLAFAMAAAGLIKNNKLLFFLGIFAVGLSRPAALFSISGACAAAVFFLIRSKNKKQWAIDTLFISLPYILAYGCIVLLQYYYTHDWLAMRHAQRFWPAHLQWPRAITDWSIEGFGMTSFAVCFVCIPSTFYICKQLFAAKAPEEGTSLWRLPYNSKLDFLFLASAFYCGCMFLFILFWKGGGLQSLSRYILASPAFFIMIIVFLQKRKDLKLKTRTALFFACAALLIILSYLVNWGGNRLTFEYTGMYLLICFTGIFYFSPIHKRSSLALIFLLSIANLCWTAYLLNDFLCNGWIFT